MARTRSTYESAQYPNGGALASSASAEERYPSRAVRILAPAAGISTDVIARIFADKLGKRLRPQQARRSRQQRGQMATPPLAVNAAHALRDIGKGGHYASDRSWPKAARRLCQASLRIAA